MDMTIKLGGQTLRAAAGANLYQVLAAAGLLDAACGGQGRCGKCRVRYLTQAPAPLAAERQLLSAADLAAGWRLACLRSVTADLTLELPETGAAAVVGAFWGGEAAGRETDGASGYGLALDIGTTTLAAVLLDLSDGRELAAAACLNSQKAFGQDVVSRIQHAQSRVTGTRELQAAVLADIRQLLARLGAQAGLATTDVSRAAVAANPTMSHLLAGVDPTPLGLAPYRLVCEGALLLRAADLALPLAAGAELYCLPAVAAHLGGDIVAGILTADLRRAKGTRLLIDIGTNGEIVLAQDGALYACSTAAGPALEGMNIGCGMRAAEGAVADVWLAGERVCYRTIGGAPARGLAGSGLLAAVCALRGAGLLEDSGRLVKKKPLTRADGRWQLVLDEAAGIVLTQADIRQVQLAKGALRAGVETLLAERGLAAQAVTEVLVAGGFGAHLPEQSLLETGILPRAWAGRIRYLGNSALAGARLCLLRAEARLRAEALARQVQYIELAQVAGYQERFIQCMRFD